MQSFGGRASQAEKKKSKYGKMKWGIWGTQRKPVCARKVQKMSDECWDEVGEIIEGTIGLGKK